MNFPDICEHGTTIFLSATLWPESPCRALQDDAVSFGNFRDYCRHLSFNYTVLSGNIVWYECGKTFQCGLILVR